MKNLILSTVVVVFALSRFVFADAAEAPKLHVDFLPNQWAIQAAAKPNLDAFGRYLVQHPATRAEIAAYADRSGRDSATLLLAQKRADAIVDYLTKRFSISPARLQAHGYGDVASGESKPALGPASI